MSTFQSDGIPIPLKQLNDNVCECSAESILLLDAARVLVVVLDEEVEVGLE